jgi:hypothetical protein
MHIVWTLYIYVSTDETIHGCFSKPNEVHEHNSLGNTAVYCFWQARPETESWISAENASYNITYHHNPPYTIKFSLKMMEISMDTCIVASE